MDLRRPIVSPVIIHELGGFTARNDATPKLAWKIARSKQSGAGRFFVVDAATPLRVCLPLFDIVSNETEQSDALLWAW